MKSFEDNPDKKNKNIYFIFKNINLLLSLVSVVILLGLFSPVIMSYVSSLNIEIKLIEGDGNIVIKGNQVEIKWPANLLWLMKSCTYRNWFWYWYFIDWWDWDRKDSPDNTCPTRHTYNIPGTYIIHMWLWHPWPTDMAITDWEVSSTIQVRSKTNVIVKDYIKDIKLNKDSFGIEDWIKVNYILNIDKKYDIIYQLFTDKWELIWENKWGPVSFNWAKDYNYYFWKEVWRKVYSWESKFYLKIWLKDENGIIKHEGKSNVFSVSLERKQWGSVKLDIWLTQDSNGNSRLAVFTQQNFHPTCYGYIVDWGDWTIDRDFSEQNNNCITKSEIKSFSHNYSKPWTYIVIFKDKSRDVCEFDKEICKYLSKKLVVE